MITRCQIYVPYRIYSAPGRCEKTKNVETVTITPLKGKRTRVKACRRHRRMMVEGKPVTIAP